MKSFLSWHVLYGAKLYGRVAVLCYAMLCWTLPYRTALILYCCYSVLPYCTHLYSAKSVSHMAERLKHAHVCETVRSYPPLPHLVKYCESTAWFLWFGKTTVYRMFVRTCEGRGLERMYSGREKNEGRRDRQIDSIGWPVSEPVSQSINRWVSQWSSQSVSRTINKSINLSISESVSQSIYESN